jgi:hypothetical protein
MLTPQEEKVLRQVARERTPMQRPHMAPQSEPNVGKYLEGELRRCGSRLPTVNANEDFKVIGKVQHAMRKGEQLMEFYSRTGLGRAQLLVMSKDEISRAVTLADERNAEDGFSVRYVAKPAAQPSAPPSGFVG